MNIREFRTQCTNKVISHYENIDMLSALIDWSKVDDRVSYAIASETVNGTIRSARVFPHIVVEEYASKDECKQHIIPQPMIVIATALNRESARRHPNTYYSAQDLYANEEMTEEYKVLKYLGDALREVVSNRGGDPEGRRLTYQSYGDDEELRNKIRDMELKQIMAGIDTRMTSESLDWNFGVVRPQSTGKDHFVPLDYFGHAYVLPLKEDYYSVLMSTLATADGLRKFNTYLSFCDWLKNFDYNVSFTTACHVLVHKAMLDQPVRDVSSLTAMQVVETLLATMAPVNNRYVDLFSPLFRAKRATAQLADIEAIEENLLLVLDIAEGWYIDDVVTER